jgi:hypothetical protein
MKANNIKTLNRVTMALSCCTVLMAMFLMVLQATEATPYNLSLKYTKQLNCKSTEIMPVMGDVDDDGVQELVTTCGKYLYVLNGKTGATEWTKNDSYWKSAELADLTNDGTPEILYGTSGPRIKALKGNGQTLWVTRTTGNGQPMFPILTAYLENDTFPTVFFATEDTSPTPYSGNPKDYQGAITKISSSGKILKSVWIEHPCWGGMAYSNSSGKGILIIGDRKKDYAGFPAKGLQAYETKNMTLIWSHPEWQHSSNMPIIYDVDNDSVMEVVATPLNRGAAVVSLKNGSIIKDYTDRGMASHGTATVYDIDKDGHAEIIQSSSYPDTMKPRVTVTDLVTGEIEFDLRPATQVAWPPKLGDLDGDGWQEILIGLGPQGKTDSYPLLIYDHNYKLTVNISLGRSGQIMPIRMYDVDSDGLYEMVVPTASGKIFVFNTIANATSIDTWKQMYGNDRIGVPI